MISKYLFGLAVATAISSSLTATVARELPTNVVDLGYKTKNMDVNSRTGVQVCAGLMNRDPSIVGPAYVLKEQRDVDWYEAAGGEVGAGEVRSRLRALRCATYHGHFWLLVCFSSLFVVCTNLRHDQHSSSLAAASPFPDPV